MPSDHRERWKAALLAKLEEAGAAGLPKAKLGVKAGAGAAALAALVAERRVFNLGSARKSRYVLSEHFNPLERACEKIEANALTPRSAGGQAVALLIAAELVKGCEGAVRERTAEAIDWLIKEKRLLRFRRGRTVYFVHAERLRGAAPPPQGGPPPEPPAEEGPPAPTAADAKRRAEISAAYRRLVHRLGYSTVEIAALARESACGLDELKRLLVEESARGRAVLSLGDWSVSSEETRAGAIELFGQPHLLVRLDEA